MSEFSKLTIDSTTYDVKDESSRNSINNIKNMNIGEVVIGSYKNEPLYRKIIETTTPSDGNVATIGTISNKDKVINLSGILETSTQNVPMNWIYSTTVFNCLYIEGNNINAKITASAYQNKNCIIIVDYTKLSD